MRNIFKALAVGVIATLAGCASSSGIAPKLSVQDVHIPEIGVVSEAKIGSPLFERKKLIGVEAFSLEQPLNFEKNFRKFAVSPQNAPLVSSSPEKDVFRVNGEVCNMLTCSYEVMTLTHNKLVGKWKLTSGFLSEEFSDVAGARTIKTQSASNSFRSELIYNGKADGNLKFIYREFVDDLARPSFTQEVSYNERDGNVIGFKGLRLEVLEVSNTNIQYRIVKPIDDPISRLDSNAVTN